MKTEVVEKTVDPQGRVMLPSKWREEELSRSNKVLVIIEKDSLRIYPMNKIKFSDFYSKAIPTEEINKFKDYKGAVAKASMRPGLR